MRYPLDVGNSQQGAALVVGMLLLLVLTLLSVSAMNSATLELVMAGNMQVQEKTFQMAEQGIETPVASPALNFVPGNEPRTLSDQSPACGGGVISNGQSNSCEQYDVTIVNLDPNGSAPITNSGNSLSKFTEYHYEITSDASMQNQNAPTRHTQTVAQLAPARQ